MSFANLPPEFLAALAGQGAAPGGVFAPPMAGLAPGAPAGLPMGPQMAPGVPMPPEGLPQPDPMAMMGGPMGMGSPMPPAPTLPAPMPPAPMPPTPPPMAPAPPSDAMLQMMMASAPPAPVVKKKKKTKLAPDKPSIEDIVLIAESDKRTWNHRNVRMQRDMEIFRQYDSGVPSTYDFTEDIRWISAAMSNLVNRLSNMMGGLEVYVEAPWKDEAGDESAQKIEDALYHCRDYERRIYAKGGGNSLQRDEFFYLFLRGWLVSRVLPDLNDDDYPFSSALLDPATCYPVWGGEKDGLIRMTRIYTSTFSEIIMTYGDYNKNLRNDLLSEYNSEKKYDAEYLTKEFEVIEYWDQMYRGVITRSGTVVMPMKEHNLGVVPFVVVSAIGEPRAMQSPSAEIGFLDPTYGPVYGNASSKAIDLAQKGVSVLHYLIHTHRLQEALMTLLYAEVEKAASPPTVRYRAQHLIGSEVPDIDYKIHGTNEAVLGLEKLEGLPTSPRPTDLSPLLQKADADFFGGSLNPAAQGMEMGPNASGYSLDTLIASAKEMVLPYLQSFENYLSLKFELKLNYLRDIILPNMSFSAPAFNEYGASNELREVTSADLEQVGTIVTVKVKNINDQNRPIITRSVIERMQAGLLSQRAGMEEVGVKRPDQMFAEIRSERALQHPLMETIVGIPKALEDMGSPEAAQIWQQAVVLPMLMQSGLMGGPPGMMGQSGPGGPSAPPNQGGQGNPMQPGQAPGGPQPGQGRGPSQ